MRNFYDLTITELQDHLVQKGYKAYNADQIYKWVYEQKVFDFEQMSNISKNLRMDLSHWFQIKDLEIDSVQESSDGTVKYLFKLEDGSLIETVLMTNDYGMSVCVTSQVGCNMGCSFCASGLIKKARDLEIFELVSQITSVENHKNIRITHVVVMGTGEPFDNYDNVMEFIRVINYKNGLQIGSRHITVSTCGIVPKIYQYAKETIKTNLAISLHAANNELRNQLMPINKAYPIEEVLKACNHYFDMTGRRITFEYILLQGVNDSKEQADELSDLLRGINCYVNLIPYNPVLEFKYKKTDQNRANEFHAQLLRRGINAILRREQGSDIDAACGQLRYKKENAI